MEVKCKHNGEKEEEEKENIHNIEQSKMEAIKRRARRRTNTNAMVRRRRRRRIPIVHNNQKEWELFFTEDINMTLGEKDNKYNEDRQTHQSKREKLGSQQS